MPYAYIAGPLFDEGERWWIEKVDATVVAAGYQTFLPHRDNPPKTTHNVETIFHNDVGGLDRCDLVVASLNGITTDDGTAWEIGYAIGIGKRVIGLHTDWRRRFDDEIVNLMIECSVETIVRSLDELTELLAR
ncbi:MAG: nucleoside 2-deoxyribosyltransferase [Acidimicrobiaceae bacterium]|jgi:nucleoside 2-deoxyribosyltransferase|nr:nucleoside 2-deoxyribosyltransferase [Acidimicrobiaceae bacterium]MBT5579029.1 nucleoside 2-deoxyribosyltransferase [Acidimicrobiaceae bacterium]MBT5851775.1 nucleoside 2-deoxyribosyltransferase [Acidimicrobiaceae bacterium]